MEEKFKKIWLINIFIFFVFVLFCVDDDLFAQDRSRSNPIPERPPIPKALNILKPVKKKNNANLVTDSSSGIGERTSSNVSMFGKPMHLSCNRSVRNLKTNEVECFGNVYIRRPTELLTSDYALINLNNEDLHAEGNVVYFTGSTVIYGNKMDFNFNTETGVISDGRIENDKYELLGEHIERLSDDEFNVKDAEYTTCRDCPPSWRLAAKSVDFKVEGYATLGNVYVKVNDAPTLYFPYAVIPVKTKRQSGLLFPKMGTSELNGFMYVQPLFWAISRSTDATLGAGYYSYRGRKVEGEFRYSLSDRSHGQFNGYYLRDKQFSETNYRDRWAMDYSHNLVFPWKIEQKVHWLDASDRDYARLFPQDISGAGEPALVSDVGISRAGRDASFWANGKRIRNNLTPDIVGFDSSAVQLVPNLNLATIDHRVSDELPLHWGVTSSYSRFWRPGSSFDPIYPTGTSSYKTDFLDGSTPLRRANRYTIFPEVYYTTRAWDVLEVVPSVQYRSFFYTFDTALAPSLQRGYLVAQTEVATTFEKVYDSEIKHKVRPSLVYSIIPLIEQESNHPFIKQLKTSGYQFDETDIVPVTNDTMIYNVPLGNSLTYQLGNKFIYKDATDARQPKYIKKVDILSGQNINFYEYKKRSDEREPLSRFFTYVSVNTLRVNTNLEYYYYPYVKASTYDLSSNYIIAQYTKRLLAFQRSFGLGYSYNQVTSHTNTLSGNLIWSINDYFQTLSSVAYLFPMKLVGEVTPGYVMKVTGGLNFQSPSQCYRVMLLASRTFKRGWEVSFNLPINLSGSTFTSFTDSGSYNLGGAPK